MLAENQDTVRLFLAVSTQWRTAGMGGVPIGLDYTPIEWVARVKRIEVTDETFEGLREMELAAIGALQEKHR